MNKLTQLFSKINPPQPQGVYRFIAKGGRGRKCQIEIRSDQSLFEFDQCLRSAFNRDWMDHLSEFYRGEWPRGGFGSIDPFGGGPGSKRTVTQLKLAVGEPLGWVYDFGDELHHLLVLEEIKPPEPNIEYPRVIQTQAPAAKKRRNKKSEKT